MQNDFLIKYHYNDDKYGKVNIILWSDLVIAQLLIMLKLYIGVIV